MYNYYLNLLGDIPEFLKKYLVVPSLVRLKGITYFCGMDYASKEIYDFLEKITRYDHSLSTSLLTYKLSKDKKMTIAALFHDVATPCFSHAIDYMNKDYATQESTETFTKFILESDIILKQCLALDNMTIDDINYKNYSLVDNNRPKLCCDRLDGLILTGLFWTKDLNKALVKKIINDIEVKDDEISFKNMKVAKEVLKVNENIDLYCHSEEDNYMMELLANITKLGIANNLFNYLDLYLKEEREILSLLENSNILEIKNLLNIFYNVKKGDIVKIELPYIKKRMINPLVNGKRLQ